MAWSSRQQARLGIEKQILDQRGFEHFRILDPTEKGKTRFVGKHTTGGGRTFELTMRIPSGFPEEMPRLYVTSPRKLKMRDGSDLTENSHYMHTLSQDGSGHTQICHWKEEYWSARNTLLNVLEKGLLWLESYDAHLRTGKLIDRYSRSFD